MGRLRGAVGARWGVQGSALKWPRSGGFWEGFAVALGGFSLAAQETSLPGKQDGRLPSEP